MAEKQGPEPDDDTRLVVGNLPVNCEQEFLVNFFESHRNFGAGIVVETVEIQDDEATLTFSRASDVDGILQRHRIKPCVLGRKELTLRPPRTCDDVPDMTPMSSIEMIDDSNVTGSYSSIYSRLDVSQRYGSLSSLASIASVASVDSNALFGSGRGGYNWSKEFNQLHIVFHPPSQEEEKCEVHLAETDIFPALISFCATTCPSAKPEDTGNSETPPSLLHNVLHKKFAGAVDVKIVKNSIILTLTENIETINNVEEFRESILGSMKLLEDVVSVKLLELDRDRFDFAIKHFSLLVSKHPTIKIYKSEDEASLYVVFLKESGKTLVETHAAIVKDQTIVSQTKELSVKDYFKIEAYRTSVDSENALVTVGKTQLIINGFQEDVMSTLYHINKILHTSFSAVKRLEDFAVSLLKNSDVADKIKQSLANSKLKVWWKLSDNFVNVVSKDEGQVSKAIEVIGNHFDTRQVVMHGYILESTFWERQKALAVVNSQNRLLIDDRSERPKVIIKGESSECQIFVEIAEGIKRKCTRHTKSLHLTGAKCDFVMGFLKDKVEVPDGEEFLRLNQENDKSTPLKAEGTDTALEKLDKRLKEISTQIFWICDEKAADTLKKWAKDKDNAWSGTVHVLENQTKVSFKTGKIEEQQNDVVVNSAGTDLTLGTGDHTITRAISMAAGERAQTSLQQITKPVSVGSVVEGDSGDLKCKAIFHAVLDKFNANDKTTGIQNLKKVIISCLDKASDRGFESIAFPALSTGVHAYPVEIAAETMFDVITEFCIKYKEHTLRELVIVFLETDKKKRKAFEECRAQRKKNFEKLQKKKKLWNTVPWPCRYFCQITTGSHQESTQLAQQVNAELMDQTFPKRLEQTMSHTFTKD